MVLKWTPTALHAVDEMDGFNVKDNPTRVTSFVLELKDEVTKLQARPGKAR